MSVQPIITFKAGLCSGPGEGSETKTIKCLPEPGFVYLYNNVDDELPHLCWTPRANTTNEPEIDLIMLPGDGTFEPYTDPKNTTKETVSPTSGRIFRLKFSSSSQRYFFWLQSKPAHPSGKPNHFSKRDLQIGEAVNRILQGEEVDVDEALGGERQDGDGDEDMGDAPPEDGLSRTRSTGGAGADATGGDIREEGEGAREGGADGGRAASSGQNLDASAAVQNFLRSLGGQGGASSAGGQQQQQRNDPFTTLPDLLTPETCISTLSNASPIYINSLLSYLPPQLLVLAQQQPDPTDISPSLEGPDSSTQEATPAQAEAAIAALSPAQKKDLLTRVFRSPQLYQSLGSLTMALRDGGLPMVSEALGIKVENGGFIRGGTMPLGEGAAVEAFVEGVRKGVKDEKKDEMEE